MLSTVGATANASASDRAQRHVEPGHAPPQARLLGSADGARGAHERCGHVGNGTPRDLDGPVQRREPDHQLHGHALHRLDRADPGDDPPRR